MLFSQFFGSRFSVVVFILFIQTLLAQYVFGFFTDRRAAAGAAVFGFTPVITFSADFLYAFRNFPVVIPVIFAAIVTINKFAGFFYFITAPGT
jgi:hypothetical protein